eukprot:CAMPEP_0117085602 /NCGR_PEP_ID=MMETSP0472-20121206/60156_1 /TAXON_ID=693140 ORGANISM="Tiarina fusus, Strain LIS" /NCGR_SAMPLE_ID=MMETSP0472 /ASSEMBLY_ACC=CAM_ASM_000603 /LENGTH=41 /DNA_ID= /DNA_START= /DNA_END= /DNA_ORIENTATION=
MNVNDFRVKSGDGDIGNDEKMDENFRNRFTQLDTDYEKLLL